MLLSLRINNIALISELELEFSKGLNILSGETGAGKSIIIDSLNFVLGDRADRGLIRHGEQSASVQAVFELDRSAELIDALNGLGISTDDDVLVVRRTMTESGRGDCRINGVIVNLFSLKSIVSLLVDIHSQHENQALLNEANHIKILDKYSKELQAVKDDYRSCFYALSDAKRELKSYASEDERMRRIDVLQFQIDEINRVNVCDGEEESLIMERAKYQNSQRVIDALGVAIAQLDGSEGFGGTPSVCSAIKELNSVSQFDSAYGEIIDRLDSVKIELNDVVATLEDELENCSYEPNAQEKCEKRLEEIRKIKRLYGATAEEIETYKQKAQDELTTLVNAEDRVAELTVLIEKEQNKVLKLARKLHDIRTESAKEFASSIVANLSELGMADSRFEVEITFDEARLLETCSADGADGIRFLISPNKGEPLKPLAKIASGGEMSRFMLGLKNITAELEGIDTLVFDEIDTGISGRIAKVVANKLYNIARTRQVLAVTHLPQLASMADTHYLISKSVVGEKTLTRVEPLDADGSLKEIMRLAGSAENSESGLQNAKEMKKAANDYKTSKIR